MRTKNKYNPFPEETNRRIATILADFHFAPTEEAKSNLLREGVNGSSIFVTGNTVIDALQLVVKRHKNTNYCKKWNNFFLSEYNIPIADGIKTILVTGHRRESFGVGFKRICHAISEVALNNPNIRVVYPVHLNPNVQKPVYSLLGKIKNVYLIPPLSYEPFVYLMNKSFFVLTDSGGIQEEAPSIGKPVLVMRDTTERPEGVKAGTAKLVGAVTRKIVTETQRLLCDKKEYDRMSKAINPYGDGKTSKRIVKVLASVGQ